jgi:uncharacterized protein involved in type VI secretion and phage assembly
MTRIPSVVTGLVTDTHDPDSQGRVNIKLPWLAGDADSYWAPVATLMTGGGRGSWFMPEVGDEVLVAFEHGDVDHPFVVGYLWNGVDRPPDAGGASVRRLRTVSGHVLEFHDDPGNRRILLQTAGGQHVELDDSSSAITIQTSGREAVRLAPGSVKASTSTGQSVELQDGGQSATVRAGGSTVELGPTGVSVTGAVRIEVSAAAMVTIEAPLVQVDAAITTFSGVVQAQTVIATSVVGAAYTPAPGNTFGL